MNVEMFELAQELRDQRADSALRTPGRRRDCVAVSSGCLVRLAGAATMSETPEIPACRILLVDDHDLVRRGLRAMLGAELAGVELGEATNGTQALAMVQAAAWSLVILDVGLPGATGIEVLKSVRRERPGLPVLLLSAFGEEQYGLRALRAGAAGYVSKDAGIDALGDAVRCALAGRRYVSDAMAQVLAAALTDGVRSGHEALSDRELEVLRLLAIGRSVKEIGFQLSLSDKTISTYRTRLLAKLALRSNAELMRYALDHDLVE
jgi:two-component system invasion response regulator UvrY